jgi:hypothetical protein
VMVDDEEGGCLLVHVEKDLARKGEIEQDDVALVHRWRIVVILDRFELGLGIDVAPVDPGRAETIVAPAVEEDQRSHFYS